MWGINDNSIKTIVLEGIGNDLLMDKLGDSIESLISDGLVSDVNEKIDSGLKELQDKFTKLEGSVDDKLKTLKDEILNDANLKSAFETLQTVESWADEHGTEYSNLLNTVTGLEESKLSVEDAEETYLTIEGAEYTYLTKEDAEVYAKTKDVEDTYATKTSLSAYVAKEDYEDDIKEFVKGDEFEDEIHKVNVEVATKVTADNVETILEGKGYLTQHQSLENYATKDDIKPLEDCVKYTQGIGKKVISLKNADLIMGETNPDALEDKVEVDASAVTIAQVNRWNVVDFGSPKTVTNLNTVAGRRVTVQEAGMSGAEAHEIAYLTDITDAINKLEDKFNLILKSYAPKTGVDMVKTITAGGDVVLAANCKANGEDTAPNSEKEYQITKDLNLELNGYELQAKGGQYGDTFVMGSGATNVVLSNGKIMTSDNAKLEDASASILFKGSTENHLTLNDIEITEGIYPIYVNNGTANSTITINSGVYYSYYSDNPAVLCNKYGTKVTINGGTFGRRGVKSPFLLNIIDKLRTPNTTHEPIEFIEVKGGEFWNFNPANNASEGAGTNYVAKGYKVEETRYDDTDDVLYTVVPYEI